MSECSGCGACSIVCPKNCIGMELNRDGFYKPRIDENRCVQCGLCEDVCPLKESNGVSLDELNLYSATAVDDTIREESSSGGIAWLIAEYAIEQGYAVCGVVYNYAAQHAEHKVFYNFTGLEQLKGSKYLQSTGSIQRSPDSASEGQRS